MFHEPRRLDKEVMQMWHRFPVLTVASLATLAAVTAGCSSSSSITPSTSSASGRQSANAGPSLNGAPIKLLLIGQITDPVQGQPVPEVASGAMAAADAINAVGGIHGRPLQITVCDDADNENKATTCAREAASIGAVATVADNTEWGTAVDPILLSEHIAVIGANPLTAADFSSPNVFPIEPGGAATVAGEAMALSNAGARHIVVARVDNPAAALVDTFVNAALVSRGLKVFKDVPVPATAPDLSSYVADATSGGADGILIAMDSNQGAQFIQALRSAGVKIPIATASSAVPPTELSRLGAAANGLYVSSDFRPIYAGGPGMSQFLSDMSKYEPSAALDDFSVNGWVSVEAFDKALAQLKLTDITNATVLAGMKQVRNLDLYGIVPNWSTIPSKLPGLSQDFNPSVMLAKISGGKVVALTGQFSYPIPGTGPTG
jgi:branched-chain amino acid transport system substrate-binding protein